MAKAAAAANPGVKSGVRIVVAGDRGTGKSSLIVTAISDTFPSSVPPVLPPTRMPDDFYPDRVPITIIDTSSKAEDAGKVAEELKRADAVVLTYACDRPETLDRLSTFWLPELRQLEVKVPVIVVGCKLDLRDENQQVSLEQVMSPIMQQFREIETCIECSAFKHIQIPEVFYYAQKAVLHPTGPLFDQESQTLKPRCVRALKRIFILCDLDRDGALSDAELNEFQVKCFNAPLQPSEIVGVKKVVEEKLPGGGVNDRGVNERGLTLTGFLFLHALFIEKGRLETTWTVLRKFGYNNDIKLADEIIPSFKRAPDQSAELTSEAVEYLRNIYELFDSDNDNNLRPAELEDIFSTAPESPWEEPPYKDAAEKTALSGLSVNAFLSEWALMTLLDPSRAVENLIYIGYPGDAAAAVRLTRRRRLDRKKQQSDRNVFHCFVFGPKKAGKSALVNSFIGRPFYDNYAPTTEESYAVHVVDLPGGIKKTLVLREIPEDGVKKLLLNKESLAPCDIAVFVYDSITEAEKHLMAALTQGDNLDPEKQTLLNQHKEKHFTAGEIVRDIIIGVSDGLTVPFALAAGLSGANATSSIVLTAGIAEVAAGAISMGLGGYLAAKSEADHYAIELTREKKEINSVPDTEAAEVAEILAQYGIEPHEYGPVVSALRKKPQAWLDFMMKFELGLEKPDPRRALHSALTIAIAYVLGGFVPLSPYMFIPRAEDAVIASVILTLAALLVFGFAKGCFTGNKPFRSAMQTVLIGAIASAAAYGMAKAVHP